MAKYAKGLEGLRGLGDISNGEREKFLADNAALLNRYANKPLQYGIVADRLYENKKFIDKFGEAAFDKMNDGTSYSYNLRNDVYKDQITLEAINKLAPFRKDGRRDNSIGFGADWERVQELSPDGRIELLNSGYLTPKQFEDKWKNYKDVGEEAANLLVNPTMDKITSAINPMGIFLNAAEKIPGASKYINAYKGASQAGVKEVIGNIVRIGSAEGGIINLLRNKRNESKVTDYIAAYLGKGAGRTNDYKVNQKILDDIYTKDAGRKASSAEVQAQVAEDYNSLLNLSDGQVKKAFIKEITPGQGNAGISEYASHYGDGKDISSEMENFSIDDMRKVISKKRAYEKFMSPMAASAVLNREAKQYIDDHQGLIKRGALFANDVTIAATAYAVDQVNGIIEPVRQVQDWAMGKPVVYVDPTNNSIVDTTKTPVRKGRDGKFYYTGADKKLHLVNPTEVSRSELHLMGKEADGSDIKGAFGIDGFTTNPLYWSRAEQFGTFDADKQKQYEKLGSSPYQVAWGPDSAGSLVYEGFKMMSFGLADRAIDAALMVSTDGVGGLVKNLPKVGKGMSKAFNVAGKVLTTKGGVGRVTKATSGALGISYAYGRGSFQDNLQKNFETLEANTQKRAENEVFKEYSEDKEYKAQFDQEVAARAEKIKAARLAALKKSEGSYIWDEDTENKKALSDAQTIVAAEHVQNRVADIKNSSDYAKAQQEAISGAGNAMLLTFWPEALKYGYVNTLGFRKFMYQNPSGVTQKVSQGLKDLKEVTTKEGLKRMAVSAKRNLTTGEKWKKFGKVAASQAWGGAWTNGTDDMMVDAASKVNEDSYNRFMQAYQNGEALASTSSFIDASYSYMSGLQASLGDVDTWRSGAAGALGSGINVTPQFVNIARLFTKKGRTEYKNNFWKGAQRDAEGNILKNEDGSVKYNSTSSKWRNIGGQLNYLLQNGVLNTYYARQQSLDALQNHADYINNILNKYDDFKDIELLYAANMAAAEASNTKDKKTASYAKALMAAHTLKNLAKNSDDPTSMSSVIQNAKKLIAQGEELYKTDFERGEESPLSEEDTKSLIAQYYANNPGTPQNMYNDRHALMNIGHNAHELSQASEALDKAYKEIDKIEKNKGLTIDPAVRTQLAIQQAMDGHWRERVEKMQQELDDPAADEAPTDGATVLATIGGLDNANSLLNVYYKQQNEIEKQIDRQKEKITEADKEKEEAEQKLEAAKKEGNSDAVYKAELAFKEARAKLESEKMQEQHLNSLRSKTVDRRNSLLEVINATEKERKENKDAKDKVLTADEIFALDPITRAKMMDMDNRSLYSAEQQAEIEKLERRLTMEDADALNKIQDISALTYQINANQDAYSKIAENPEAASYAASEQMLNAAKEADMLVNQRNADTIVRLINDFDRSVENDSNTTNEDKEALIYEELRKLQPRILNTIEEGDMLPQYRQQVKEAKEWSKTTEDLGAVIASMKRGKEWKENMSKNILGIANASKSKAEFLENLEKVIDDNPGSMVAEDLDNILKGMEEIGYQRNATVIEKRNEKKKREEEDKAKRDLEKKRAEEAAKAAAQAANDEALNKDNVDLNDAQLVDLGDIPFGDTGSSNDEGNGSDESNNGNNDIEIDVTTANQMMDDKVGEGTISLGKTVVKGSDGKLQQVPITVEKKEGKISFSAAGESTKITVSPNSFESTSETKEHEKNTPFEATSMEKKDGNWYLNGNFAGDTEKTQVKAKEGFSIDKTIKDNETALKDIDPASAENITVLEDGTVVAETPSLEQQAVENQGEGKEIHVIDVPGSTVNENEVTTSTSETEPVTLSGNGMSRYDSNTLSSKHVEKRKQGAKEGDSMNLYFKWMDAAGIKLQNIIDFELPRILKANPETKVRFMSLKPDKNSTNDYDMRNHLMLVVEYDDKVNKGITKIHNDGNGGVIESNGKKYLVIGVAGFSNQAQHDLYDHIWWPQKEGGLNLKSKRTEFFNNHPGERFWVSDLSTEIKPMSQIPGFIVKQMENDEGQSSRNVIDLLNDDSRNPYKYKLENVVWGIQQGNKFMVINSTLDSIKPPVNSQDNQGRAFVFVPASNGKLIPVALQARFYQEMNEGKLSERVGSLIERSLNPETAESSYNDAIKAIDELCHIFYLRKGMQDIHRKGKTISLEHDGRTEDFNLDSPEERQAFKDAFTKMNPRINITAEVLGNFDRIKEYSEAGALNTDAALFGTAGSSYNIYGLDGEGKMMKPSTLGNNPQKAGEGSFRKTEKQIIFNHLSYIDDNGTFTLRGERVTDEGTLKQLNYLKRILDGELVPIKREGTEDYYILSAGDNPEVVKVDKNTKKVTEMNKEEAKAFVEEIKIKKEAELREKAAQAALVAGEGDGKDDGEKTSFEVDYDHPEKSIQIVRTYNGMSTVFKPTSDNPLFNIKDLIEENVGWGEENGLLYYMFPISGRAGDYSAFWFKDKLSEEQKKDIEQLAMLPDTDVNSILDVIAGKELNPEISKKMEEAQKDYEKTITEHTLTSEDIDSVDYSNNDTTDIDATFARSYLKGDVKSKRLKEAYKNIYERIHGVGSWNKERQLKPENVPFGGTALVDIDKASTQTFDDLANSKEYKNKLLKILLSKFQKKSLKASDYKEDLKKAGIKIEGIGTSKEDIDAWIKTIEDCR